MNQSIREIIEKELKENLIFKEIFHKFKIPNLTELKDELDLAYESNEYMGYYKKDLYFDLVPEMQEIKSHGILKLTFVSSTKKFDIQKAMHVVPTNENYIVSTTFRIYDEENSWDAVRYSYTLWKNNKA